ncbi:MAG: response regulator, partial [Candidatus Faecousia sp.]|nr:response regulator [Candidatus Faecousia sp.]
MEIPTPACALVRNDSVVRCPGSPLQIPIYQCASKADNLKTGCAHGRKKRRTNMLKILIVEDDRELRQLFAHVLIKNGYRADGVSNGREALDAMEKDYYDLIISDIMM